jgi:sugar phosphate isomerase/epimerase
VFKLGFCYPMDWETSELYEQLSRLKALGYDGVEIWNQNLEPIDLPRLADWLREIGIACAQICPYFDFVHGQEKWDETMRTAETYIERSRLLGNPLVRVFTGGGVGPDNATEEQWNAAIAGLQRICDMAAPDVRLCLECHTGSLMEDVPNTLRLLRGVDRPNLGVNLQLPLKSGHEPVDYSLEHLGRHTWHMHAHNYTAIIGGEQRPLGEGVLDYQEILTRLIAQGFDGYISIEHANHEGKRDPWEIAAIEARYLTDLREELRATPGGK